MVTTKPLDLETQLAKAIEEIDALKRDVKILLAENALLKRDRFGRSSERMEPQGPGLFDVDDLLAPAPAPLEQAPKKKSKTKTKNRAFAAHLPREEVTHDLPTSERSCDDCGKELIFIGSDITERGHIIPAQLVVRKHTRHKYGCPNGCCVKTGPAPTGVIDGGKYEASVYAHVANAKYGEHVPLHRLESSLKRKGMHLSRQTMWDLLVRVDELVAQPILAQMKRELLACDVLHADETPVTMRKEGGKGSKQGYVYNWRNLRELDEPSKVLFEFVENRSRHGPLDFLGDWTGTLILDGYAGYNSVIERNHILRAGCWSHARRKFKEALDTGCETAGPILALFQRLFGVERESKVPAGGNFDNLVDERKRLRDNQSRGIVEAIYEEAARLDSLRSSLPKSKLGKAIGFLFRQKGPLTVFLDDPRIPIHNNDSERDLRHIAVGRNNWQVFGSPRGGQVGCRMFGLILSARQSGIDPEAYVEDLLTRIETTPASKIASLTPWAWAEARKAETGSN